MENTTQTDQPASSPETPEAAAAPLSFSIDLITRITASVLFIMYGAGFVILAFHDAKYGVVQFSPFRTRILLVGFVFTTLVALAAGAQHYSLAYFGPLKPVMNDSEPKRRVQREIVLMAGFIFTAVLISIFLSTFLFHSSLQPSKFPLWQSIASAAAYFLGLALFVVSAHMFLAKPNRAVFLSLVGFAIAVVSLLFPNAANPRNHLTIVLTLVGWTTTWIKREKKPIRYALDFRNWQFALCIFWLYINYVFSGLPPRWGGGQPTPIQLFQSNPAPWSPSNPVDALLLDETDQGFYVLLSPSSKAYFIPRTNVASVFFGSKEDLPKKP
jgi:MFS family permease